MSKIILWLKAIKNHVKQKLIIEITIIYTKKIKNKIFIIKLGIFKVLK